MKLAVVCMARNESDIIENFVRSNLGIIDAIYVALHRSGDGTLEICEALKREGLPLQTFEDREEGFWQDVRINELARRAFAEGADYVFPLDADELLHVRDRPTLLSQLVRIPKGVGASLRWLTYIGTNLDDAAEPRASVRMRHRLDVGPPWSVAMPQRVDANFAKLVVGRWFADTPDAHIYEGNHVVSVGGQVAMTACKYIEVAHFPVRSLEQLVSKAVTGWEAYLASGRDPVKLQFASHWQFLHDQYRANGQLTWEDAREFVLRYVPPEVRGAKPAVLEDPVADRCPPLRYLGLARERG